MHFWPCENPPSWNPEDCATTTTSTTTTQPTTTTTTAPKTTTTVTTSVPATTAPTATTEVSKPPVMVTTHLARTGSDHAGEMVGVSAGFLMIGVVMASLAKKLRRA